MHNSKTLSSVLKFNSMFIGMRRAQIFEKRNLWKFTHIYMPEKTPDGHNQRKPTEHPDFMKYSFESDEEILQEPPPVKMILLEDMDDFGQKYDVVEAEASVAQQIILLKKAKYASEFDLDYFARKKEEMMKDDSRRRITLPRELIKLGQKLAKQIITVQVPQQKEWTMNADILFVSLELSGIYTPIQCIHLASGEPLKGPNLEDEAKLFRFYIVIENNLIVPMVGRIKHISSTGDQENLFPSDTQFSVVPDENDLRPETLYFNANGLVDVTSNVGDFMAKRPSNAQTGIN